MDLAKHPLPRETKGERRQNAGAGEEIMEDYDPVQPQRGAVKWPELLDRRLKELHFPVDEKIEKEKLIIKMHAEKWEKPNSPKKSSGRRYKVEGASSRLNPK